MKNKKNEEEFDLLDLSVSKPEPSKPGAGRYANPFNPIETETNVFTIEFDKKGPPPPLAPRPPLPPVDNEPADFDPTPVAPANTGPQVIVKDNNQRFIGTETTFFELGALPAGTPPPSPLPVVASPPSIAVAPIFTKLAHVCIYVKDIERSIEFYSKLGMEQRFVFYREGKLYGAYLEFGHGNFIELFEDAAGDFNRGRIAHFCIETPNIEVAMQMLAAAGVKYTPKKLGCDSTYQIWLKDPDGNDFEIHQYTAKSSQIVGGVVEVDW
jgi:lactoylglutathione lyase/glyoxylase I family protein